MSDVFLKAFKANENHAVVPQFFNHEGEVCVRVLLGGNSRFAPVYRAKDFYDRDEFGQDVTYADRWPDQYQQFLAGAAQTADGTPLEQAPFLNESRIRDLRHLKVFSIEGLASFDDRYISRLGGNGYKLKELAQEFLQQKAGSPDISRLSSENEQLRAMMEQMQAQIANLQTTPAASINDADDYRQWSDDQVRESIKEITGRYPNGQPKRETLIRMLIELKAEQAA